MKNLFFLLALAISVTACKTAAPISGEKPPEHARRVQVAIYDMTARTATTKLDVFDQSKTPPGPYRQIATLTCEGGPEEEAAMMHAIGYRARMLGADGIIIQQTEMVRNGFGVAHRRVFRATAILITAQ